MRRKRLQEDFKKNYSTRQRFENQRIKALAAMEKFRPRWKELCRLHVPKWMQIVSLYVPPQWYVDIMKFVWQAWPPNGYVKWVGLLPVPNWVRWLMVMPLYAMVVVLRYVAYEPLIWIRMVIQSFGITYNAKRNPDNEDQVTFVTKYWWKVVDEFQIDLKALQAPDAKKPKEQPTNG
jgi:hypothetical protein